MFRRSFPIHQFDLIDDKIEINYIEYYKVLFKEICLYPKRKYIKYIGEYENKGIRKKKHIENWHETINRHFYIDNKECVISEISLNYLDSIISFCNKMNIVTILVRTPEHSNYYKNIPTLFLMSVRQSRRKVLFRKNMKIISEIMICINEIDAKEAKGIFSPAAL